MLVQLFYIVHINIFFYIFLKLGEFDSRQNKMHYIWREYGALAILINLLPEIE